MAITLIDLPLAPYEEVWNLQKRLQRELIEGSEKQALIVCEHPPTITVGRSAKRENILVGEEQRRALGVSLYEIERGGDVTYHGPGQIVAYPILNLNLFKRDVDWYMRALEETLLRTLQHFYVAGMRISGKTGVWVQHRRGDSCEAEPKKIASLGVRISRWCTLHGVALNVRDGSAGFALINPCGFPASAMTSIDQERQVSAESSDNGCSEVLTPMIDVRRAFIESFAQVFAPVSQES